MRTVAGLGAHVRTLLEAVEDGAANSVLGASPRRNSHTSGQEHDEDADGFQSRERPERFAAGVGPRRQLRREAKANQGDSSVRSSPGLSPSEALQPNGLSVNSLGAVERTHEDGRPPSVRVVLNAIHGVKVNRGSDSLTAIACRHRATSNACRGNSPYQVRLSD